MAQAMAAASELVTPLKRPFGSDGLGDGNNISISGGSNGGVAPGADDEKPNSNHRRTAAPQRLAPAPIHRWQRRGTSSASTAASTCPSRRPRRSR